MSLPSARLASVVCLCLLAGVPAGCQPAVRFPTEPVSAAGVFRAYDVDGDGRADFFLLSDESGRVDRLGYDRSEDGLADNLVDLDAIAFERCRHLVIILDGVGYELLREYYDAGGLRMFHPPSRVIAPYPAMTDLAMEDILNYIPAKGYEARYYDHTVNRLRGGATDYLRGVNQPYGDLLTYRSNLIWDAIGYVFPGYVYTRETNSAKKQFDRRQTQEFLAYFVSSAGLGTRQGREGHVRTLRRVEQMVNQVLWETRGLVKITLLADHGHTYTPARPWRVEQYLAQRGWRLRKSLSGPEDVVMIRFGLVTFASFATGRPAQLAEDLAGCEGVEVVSYAEGASVVVLSGDGGRAAIHHKDGRYRYEPIEGDPLRLSDILPRLNADAGGYYDADDLLRATVRHIYPAPLQRLWLAHFGLVLHPADVLCSLKDDYFVGSERFAGAVDVASTHGGLNERNAATFIMSTVGPLPPVMRARDIHRHLGELIGRPWPLGR